MKRRLTILGLIVLAALISIALTATSPAYAGGATQIFGVGNFTDEETCPLGEADFGYLLTGDLEGCFYGFVDIDTIKCSSGWIYQERGTNLFIGYDENENVTGTFQATYRYMGKFEDCNFPDGFEFFGRCHHPIIVDSGTGIFEGVSGQLKFEDYIEKGIVQNFPYSGQLIWSGPE